MISDRIYDTVTDDDADTVDAGRKRNFAIHFLSLGATKTADGLLDPKLVLAWLLSAAGAPGYLVGALVPVRESGALLPQVALAEWIQRSRQRRWFWVVGSLIQGIAALGIAAAAVWLQGVAAGVVVLALLAVLAVARSACSASYKDVLARTVEKGTRGTVKGAAGSIASVVVFAFAVSVAVGIIPLEPWAIALAVAVAGILWTIAALVFSTLKEPDADTSEDAGFSLSQITRPLRGDPEFRRYVASRALLIATALAPPFIVMLSHETDDGGLGNLGVLIIGSSAAAIASSYIWGRLSDRSSRWTLALSGISAAVALGAVAATGFFYGGIGPGWLAAVFIFFAQIGYQGVRAGRSTHLADMDTHGRKAAYTALSNTLIGVLLLAGGAFGLVADVAGPSVVLAIFAAMSLASVPVSLALSEVQQED